MKRNYFLFNEFNRIINNKVCQGLPLVLGYSVLMTYKSAVILNLGLTKFKKYNMSYKIETINHDNSSSFLQMS